MGDQRRLFACYFLVYVACAVAAHAVSAGLSEQLATTDLARAALTALGPAFVVVILIQRYVWRFSIVRKLLGVTIPYIQGRWEGSILSSYSGHLVSHRVAVEFWQTLTELAVWYYDVNAITHSLLAGFVREVEGGPLRVYCVYRNQPIRTEQRSLQTHHGVMELVVEPSGRRIVGTYYNNPHQRATYGAIDLTFVGRKRLGAFEKAST